MKLKHYQETTMPQQRINTSWISVEKELPTGNCLAFYKNSAGKERIVKAFYARQYEIEQSPNEEFQEYNEYTDEYYLP